MHTPNWPTSQTFKAQVERVRNDGDWIIGDPLDTATRPAGTKGTVWAYPPRLYARHLIDGAPLPDFPGWDTPRLGFMRGRVMHMEYLPAGAARQPVGVQLDIFDFL